MIDRAFFLPALALLALALPALGLAALAQEADGRAPQPDGPPELPVEVVESGFPEDLLSGIAERGSGWIPYYVELRALRERPVTVEVAAAIEKPEDRRAVTLYSTRRRIEVPPGAPTRLWLYLRYPPVDPNVLLNVTARVTVQGVRRELAGGQIHFGADPDEQAIPMVVSGDHTVATRSPWGDSTLDGLKPRKISTSRIARIEEKKLPDSRLGYQAARMLVLRNFDEKAMEPAQIDAIRRWVLQGGWVILVPSPRGEIFRTRLARDLLAGARIGEPRAAPGFVPRGFWTVEAQSDGGQRRVRPLARLEKSEEGFSLPGGTSYTLVDPVEAETEREIHSGSEGPGEEGGARLYYEVARGDGRVGVMTFDDLTFGEDSLTFRRKLWAEILSRDPPRGGCSGGEERREPRVQEALLTGLTRDVGVWFIAGLVIAYLVVVGPGIYLALKRMNRLTSIVWVEPLVVLLYLGIIAATAYLTKGFLTRMRLLNIQVHCSGEPFLIREGYLGLFSADETVYRITAPGSEELYPLPASAEGSLEAEVGREGPVLRDRRLLKWASGAFACRGLKEVAPGFGVEVIFGPGELGRGGTPAPRSVTIRNRTGFRILRGFLAHSSGVIPTGEILPGGELELENPFEPAAGRSPPEGPAGTGGGPAGAKAPGEGLLDLLTGRALELFGSSSFIAVIEREEPDFVLDRAATIDQRLDLFVERF